MKLNIFPIPIYIGNIETDKIIISNKGFEKTWLSETESSHNFLNKIEDSSWAYLQTIIADLLKEDFNFSYELTLKSIWENQYKASDFQENHIHTGSHFSFIIYKEIEKSNTVFLDQIKIFLILFMMENLINLIINLSQSVDPTK